VAGSGGGGQAHFGGFSFLNESLLGLAWTKNRLYESIISFDGSGTAPLMSYEGPRTEAEAARLCGLAAEYGEEGEEGTNGGQGQQQQQQLQRQRQRAAL
jgi:hypothetical protein